MGYNFLPCDRDQLYLLPPALQDWLPERDLAFRVITANQGPDHTTIARFRQTHETELSKLFTQVLRLCAEAGLVKVGGVALDGTKIQASAALASNRTAETIAAAVSRMLGGINPHQCEIELFFDKDGKLDDYNYSSGC